MPCFINILQDSFFHCIKNNFRKKFGIFFYKKNWPNPTVGYGSYIEDFIMQSHLEKKKKLKSYILKVKLTTYEAPHEPCNMFVLFDNHPEL
jgi:hypothetical protein